MDSDDGGLQEVVGGATAEELRGLLVALEGRVVDLGRPSCPPEPVLIRHSTPTS